MNHFNFVQGGFSLNLLILLLIVWTLFWKGYALWLAAKNNNKKWFVALIILNTAGILEIIYVFGVLNKKWSDVTKSVKRIFTHGFK